MPPAIALRGQRDLLAAVARADNETRRDVHAGMRAIAEPVRRDAETLARQRIPRIGPRWPVMRTGVTRRVVYVAPKQRGLKTRPDDPRRRPNLAPLLMGQAMQPALDRHAADFERLLEHELDRIADRFNHPKAVV
jgi:hypothetical protein